MGKLEESFEKKGIDNDYKIRRFFPTRYQDFSKETGCINGDAVCIGVMLTCQNMTSHSGTEYIQVRIRDRKTNNDFKVLIFNQPFAFRAYADMLGKTVLAAGKMQYGYGSYSIAGPQILTDKVAENMKLLPIYSKVGNSKPFYVKKKIKETCMEPETDTVPEEVIKTHMLPGLSWSLYEMHDPASLDDLMRADNRLLVDDLWYFASCSELAERDTLKDGTVLSETGLEKQLLDNFGYELTKDQKSTYESISTSLQSGIRVHALVQGDVGCGKTIVSFLLMAQAVSSGRQAILMAPTKILAEQHYQKLCMLLPEYADRTYLAAGKKPLKKDITKIKNGEYRFIVGTHTLVSDNITFNDPGLIVIDEEHKFGVLQRQKLEKLSKDIHCISMSATPIPRTLAQALYGEHIEIYSIHSKPAGREPVYTAYDNGTHTIDFIRSALSRDEQVYIVCPAIETEEEKMPGVLSVKEAYEKYTSALPDAKIEMLNGKMKADETEQVLAAFKEHRTDILISTTVVEVGIDVPNATLIILQNAERFGLAGMHQLRGRVGRGDKPSCCLLVSETNNERIQALCSTTDGFEIAMKDLELRKSGTLFGLEQSGYNVITEEVMSNPELYNQLRKETAGYSKVILNRHIKKMEMCHNPKRRNPHGIGGKVYALNL